MGLNHKMAEQHEDDLAQRLGGRRTKGSGSQWTDQTDVRHSRYHQRFAFAVEAKSTLGKSIGVSRQRIEKAEEQAHAERPMLALRFYGNERLTQVDHDWVAMRLDDHEEMVEVIEQGERLRAFMRQADEGLWDHVLYGVDIEDRMFEVLIMASQRECLGTIKDDHGAIEAHCSCGWYYPVPLGHSTRDADRMLAEHLDV